MSKRGVPCLVFLTLTAASISADTYVRQPAIDVQHYTFRLTLSDSTDEIAGEADVDLRFVQSAREFSLDLTSVAGGKGMTVASVTSSRSPVAFTHQANQLRITPAPPVAAGDRRVFTIQYRGTPGRGLQALKTRYGDRAFFSENWPDNARQWLPVVDHPSDKATSEFVVTAPSRYQVVANGLLQEVTDLGDGRRRTHWKQSVPIAVWLNAIGAAHFAVHYAGRSRGIEIQSWVFPQDRERGWTAFEGPARRALEFFSDSVGPYPYEKLANVEAAGLDGATEHASAIFYSEALMEGKPFESIVAHEVAHQWFGNSVTETDWDDVWLSEGFATYFAHLYTEHYRGRDAFVDELKRSRDTVFATETQLQGKAIVHNNISDMRTVLNPLVYEKAGWFLHMLRSRIGSEKFFEGIREYYRRYRDGNASTADFRRVMEEASGERLEWFFDQWLKRAGSPVVSATWRYDAAARKVELELTQSHPDLPYRLAVGVQVGSVLHQIEMRERTHRYEFPQASAPPSLILDPDTTLLAAFRLQRLPN